MLLLQVSYVRIDRSFVQVAMMIPILENLSIRLALSPDQVFMPLSIAAQLGGSLTLIGSSVALVAQQTFDTGEENPSEKVWSMRFFDLFPVGLLLVIAGTKWIPPFKQKYWLQLNNFRILGESSGNGRHGFLC